jgi:hypothetical protein
MNANVQNKKKAELLVEPFNHIAPYFSAIVYKENDTVDLDKLKRYTKIELNNFNNNSTRHYYYFEEEFIDNALGIFTVCHKSIPTWLTDRRISRDKNHNYNWENYEIQLVVIYKVKGYIFLSCKDDRIVSFFQNAFNRLDDSIASIIDKELFQHNQAFIGNNKKVIGLKNSLGYSAGGRIPESKSYTGNDCGRSINGTTDHIFKVSHIGSQDDEYGYSGASMKKRKIWGGWSECITNFIEICNLHADSFLSETNEREPPILQCLAKASSKDLIKGVKPVLFKMDSAVKGKGIVCLKRGDRLMIGWNAYLPQFENDIIHFELTESKEVTTTTKIRYQFDDNGTVTFEYADLNEDKVKVVFLDENEPESRGRDLIKYLNKGLNFLFLYSGGVAYSDGECVKMEKLNQCIFDKAQREINWSNVDITKEEKTAVHPKINILQRLEEYVQSLPNLLFASNDNGANEVADIVLLFKNKIVFIHAKYSSKPLPGLRIGDLQEVSAQAIKNVNFAVPEPYSHHQLSRLYENLFYNLDGKSFEDFASMFIGALDNYNIRKEVWIVQPGLDISKLALKTDNKAHTLLSYVEVVLNSAQLELKVIGY